MREYKLYFPLPMQDHNEVFYVNKTYLQQDRKKIFATGLRFQTGLISVWVLCKQSLTLLYILCCCRFVHTLNVHTILLLLDQGIYDGMNKDIKEEHIQIMDGKRCSSVILYGCTVNLLITGRCWGNLSTFLCKRSCLKHLLALKNTLLCSYLKPEIQKQSPKGGELRVGSGECYTLRNVAKHSMECCNKLWRIFPNVSCISLMMICGWSLWHHMIQLRLSI